MVIEIEGSPKVLFELFEAHKISTGMTREVPGDASIRYLPHTQEEHRGLGALGPVFSLLLSTGKDIAVGVLSAWLYDRLNKSNVRTVRINRQITELTPEGIQRAIQESIEITEKSRH